MLGMLGGFFGNLSLLLECCAEIILKIQYFPLSIACCDLLADSFVMLKILRLLFATGIKLVNNRHLAPMKTKTTTEAVNYYGEY